MRSLFIYSVTYNSYKELNSFLQSVDRAASRVCQELRVTVCVIDNTEEDVQDIVTDYKSIEVLVFRTGLNLGYMGGVQACMEHYSPLLPDFSVISNVDLEVRDDAFEHLLRLGNFDGVGIIAPCTYSQQEYRDKNPQLLTRYSRIKLHLLYLLYRFPWLNDLYERTIYKRKHFASKHKDGELVYAAHGSFMIFTNLYFQRVGIPQYPVFLFGEEIYFAEKCLKSGLYVRYTPGIVIIDSEHCSTGALHSDFYYKCNREAIKYILTEFY